MTDPQSGGSGAGSTVVQWPDLSYLSPADREPYERLHRSVEKMAQTIAQLRADLDAARSEIERLKAFRNAYRETEADLAHAQSRIQALERVADVVRKCWNTSSWCPPEIGEALDAAQATAEPEK